MNKVKTSQSFNLNPILTKVKEADAITTQIHIFINIFNKLSGFDKILNLLKWEKYFLFIIY